MSLGSSLSTHPPHAPRVASFSLSALGGGEGWDEVGGGFGFGRPPTSPSRSQTRWVPSLSPRERVERVIFSPACGGRQAGGLVFCGHRVILATRYPLLKRQARMQGAGDERATGDASLRHRP